MKKNLTISSIIVLLITVSMIVPIVRYHSHHYVTGKYAKYCYKDRNKSVHITKKYYFDTLEHCGKPLK